MKQKRVYWKLKLKKLDSSYFRGKSHFEEDGTENYLAFQSANGYFKLIANTLYISEWKSKGLSGKRIKPPSTSDNSFSPLIDYYGSKGRLKFSRSCLKQANTLTHAHKTTANIYIVYELGASCSSGDDPTLKNSLFGAVRLTKNAHINKYHYSGYGIGFDRKGSFSSPGNRFGQNVIIFGADMSSSVHVDNKGKDILILGFGPAQGFGEHSFTAEKMYSINFIVTKKKFCLSLHYDVANSYLFVNGSEIIKFKDSNIVSTPLCLGNISKDW